MLEKKSIGKDVESYCGKCKAGRDHTIMTMDGETIAKVRCKMCGSMHKFTNSLDAKKVRKPRAKQGPGGAATAETVWVAGLAQAKGKEQDYSMTSRYRIGDIVNHQMFGKGIVTKLYVNKCEMLFKDKERLMASTNQ
jgi:hypothetical protein